MKSQSEKQVSGELKRGLRPRHMQMIAIGGAIGVGLFYGSSGAIQYAGPAVLIAYIVAGLVMFFVCRAVGEIAVEEPVAGASIAYASKYIHPFAGFALGWTGLFGIVLGSGSEFTALGSYVQYWFPQVPAWISGLAAMVLLTVVNLISVRLFGEIEFWMSAVKVLTIIVMIVCGLIIILTGMGIGGKAPLLSNLVAHGGFFPNGVSGLILSLVLVTFAFGGTDSVATTAGEAVDVKNTMPKAINGVFWRILIFYVGSTFVILCLWPWDKLGGVGSPFVQVFSKLGVPAAASIINFVVLTASMSSINSGMYGLSRSLYNLTLQGRAPGFLARTTRNKVPYIGVLTVSIGLLLGLALTAIIPSKAFAICSSITVISLIAGWVCELVSELHFRIIMRREGKEKDLTFKMPLWPYSNIIALIFMLVILVVLAILPDYRISYFVAIPWVLFIYVAYRIQERHRVGEKGKVAIRESAELREDLAVR